MKLKISSAVWVFVDLLFNILLAALYQNSMLAVPKHADPTSGQGIAAGALCVQLSWPDDRSVDIDLWGKSPPPAGEESSQVVYYRNKSNGDMDLLRDDVGRGDPAEHHFETMCAHSLRPGEWTFNATYFGNEDKGGDVPISMTLTFPMGGNDASHKPIKLKSVLHHEGDDVTLINFILNKDGVIEKDSINSAPVSLRGEVR